MTGSNAIPHPLWPRLLEMAQSRAGWRGSQVQHHWRLMDGANGRPGTGSTRTQPPAAPTAFSGSYIAGLLWKVTAGSLWLDGYWWWVPPAGGLTAAQKCALWCVTGPTNSSAKLVPGSVVTSGTLAAGWNFISISAPVQLSPHTTYVAATAVNGAFPLTQNQFGSGNPYSAGIVNGPLVAYSDTGGSNPEPYGQPQGPFTTAGGDPAVTVPLIGDVHDILWLDVSVTDVPPANYSGTYEIFPSKFDASHTLLNDAAATFTLSVEYRVSVPVTSSYVKFYSPAGATSLPTWAGIHRISDQALIAANASPAWLALDGTPSPSAGSGWVKCALAHALPPDKYKVSVYNAGGASGTWSPTTYGYWNSPAQSGITQGPVSAPGQKDASAAYVYFNNPVSAPPWTDGTSQEPSQGTWLPTGPAYPYVAVDFTWPGTSNPAGAVAENFWADMVVKPDTLGIVSLSATAVLGAAGTRGARGAAALAAAPSLTVAGTRGVPGTAHLSAAPSLGAAGTRGAAGAAPLSAPGALAAAASLSRLGTAHLSASPSLTATGFPGRQGHVALAAAPSLAPSGTVITFARGSAHLAASPGLAAGGSVVTVVPGGAALAAVPLLTAAGSAVKTPEGLWVAYLSAFQEASGRWAQWRMMRQAGGTDGTAGFLYGQAYEAQEAADQAYEAWRLAQQQAFPGRRG